jgi:hypothetical protein
MQGNASIAGTVLPKLGTNTIMAGELNSLKQELSHLYNLNQSLRQQLDSLVASQHSESRVL